MSREQVDLQDALVKVGDVEAEAAQRLLQRYLLRDHNPL